MDELTTTPAAPAVAPAALSPVVEPTPATPEPALVPDSPNAETDKHLNEKRKRNRGAEARILGLLGDKKELQKQLAAKEAADATSIPKPALASFSSFEDYSAALAVWAADDRARRNGGAPAPTVTPSVTAPIPKVESAPAPATPSPTFAPEFVAMRKEEFDGFYEKGRQLMARQPDFISTIEAAERRGLNMSLAARVTITKLQAPEVMYHLARPENDAEARRFMKMNEFDQALEVARIAETLRANPSDFVSSAPPPGRRLNGGGAHTDLRPDELDTDEYVRRNFVRRGGRLMRRRA